MLDNTYNNQNFQETSVGFTVQNVQFDPEHDLISRNNNVILGTNDLSFGKHVVFYPNPAQSSINIQKPEALQVNQVRIYNALGQLLLAAEYSQTMDLSKLASGILFFQLETSEGVINKTVVKE